MNTAAHALPLIGITMGDPVGIGPEVVIKALSCADVYRRCRPVVLGDTAVLEKEKKALNSPLAIHVIEDPRQAAFTFGTLDIFPSRALIRIRCATVTRTKRPALPWGRILSGLLPWPCAVKSMPW